MTRNAFGYNLYLHSCRKKLFDKHLKRLCSYVTTSEAAKLLNFNKKRGDICRYLNDQMFYSSWNCFFNYRNLKWETYNSRKCKYIIVLQKNRLVHHLHVVVFSMENHLSTWENGAQDKHTRWSCGWKYPSFLTTEMYGLIIDFLLYLQAIILCYKLIVAVLVPIVSRLI